MSALMEKILFYHHSATDDVLLSFLLRIHFIYMTKCVGVSIKTKFYGVPQCVLYQAFCILNYVAMKWDVF